MQMSELDIVIYDHEQEFSDTPVGRFSTTMIHQPHTQAYLSQLVVDLAKKYDVSWGVATIAYDGEIVNKIEIGH